MGQSKPVFALDNGVARVSVPDDIVEEGSPLWEKFVVGYFMGDAPYVGKIHATVNRIWNSGGSPSRVDVQFLNPTTVLFRIDNHAARARVLRRKYWHIADIPLVVIDWSPETANERPDLSAMPLWVDLKGVPGHMFSQKGLRYLGDITGNFVRLHPNTERCTRLDMARVLVEVDLSSPLTEKICFSDKSGAEVTVTVSYPWLPPRCNGCSKWGHKEEGCNASKPKTILTQPHATVIQSVTPGSTATEFGVTPSVSESDVIKVQNLISDLDKLHVIPAATGIMVKTHEQENGRVTQQEGHGDKEDGWSTVIRSGHPLSSTQSQIVLCSNGPTELNEVPTSPSRFQILAEIPEEGEIVESEIVGEDTILVEDLVHVDHGKQSSKQPGKKRKPILHKRDMLKAGVHINAKKASSRKL